ncbi:MAG: hypothetical protein SFW66_08270 [Gammaproteobacteria bacterium]|nr:hypothetical protein [Gammaproteobacteria bacterium]
MNQRMEPNGVFELLGAGWRMVRGLKGYVFLLLLIIIGLNLLALSLPALRDFFMVKIPSNPFYAILVSPLTFIPAFFIYSITVLCVSKCLGKTLTISEACGACFGRLGALFVLYLLIEIIFSLPQFFFYIAPPTPTSAILLAVSAIVIFFFIVPLQFFASMQLIIGKASLSEAITSSYKKMSGWWGRMIGMTLILFIISFSCIFIIPLFWVVPWWYTSFGVLYREAYNL